MWLLAVVACITLVLSVMALAQFLAVRALLSEVRDNLIVLHVSTDRVETKLGAEVLAARESADAAVAGIVDLQKALEKEVPRAAPSGLSVLESMGKFGRAMAARELFAKAEQDSLDEVTARG